MTVTRQVSIFNGSMVPYYMLVEKIRPAVYNPRADLQLGYPAPAGRYPTPRPSRRKTTCGPGGLALWAGKCVCASVFPTCRFFAAHQAVPPPGKTRRDAAGTVALSSTVLLSLSGFPPPGNTTGRARCYRFVEAEGILRPGGKIATWRNLARTGRNPWATSEEELIHEDRTSQCFGHQALRQQPPA